MSVDCEPRPASTLPNLNPCTRAPRTSRSAADPRVGMWRIEVLDSSSLQPSKSIPLPPGTHDVGREIPGNSDKRLSRKQLQLTLPTDSRVAMLKVTGANPSILQSAAGACQDLTKSTPAVTVGPGDVIWLGREPDSSQLKHPIRVVATPGPRPLRARTHSCACTCARACSRVRSCACARAHSCACACACALARAR